MKRIHIEENGIYMVFEVIDNGSLKLLHLSALPFDESELHYRSLEEGFNLVEIDVAGADRPQERHGTKYIATAPGYHMKYVSHEDTRNDQGRCLTFETEDSETGIHVRSHIQFYDGLSVVRMYHDVINAGKEVQTITYVSTLNYSGIDRGGERSTDEKLKLVLAHNKWQGELCFKEYRLPDLGLIKTQPDTFVRRTSNVINVFNTGNWSTKHYLPMGYLVNEDTGADYYWQIEHNGSWHWEISDQNNHLYLQLSGPTENESHWFKHLEPGESFTTVPAAFGVGKSGFDDAMGNLTRYRRRIRRQNEDNENLPIIFNDYMNCLFGDPTTEKELPLIDAAAKAGCEYFVIDAGWYADGNWWDSVGEWQESRKRFPNGLKEVTDYIREKGMIPGAWLELEVMGIHCKKADELPDECFFMRHGKRIYDRSRYQLDFRNPLVIAHADEVVDRLVKEYGIGYIKMDYNIEPGIGTEVRADSAGEGLLEHERAYLAWLDRVFERYPYLVIENCSSGGLRMDYAMLSRYSIQSTSDQENYRLYAMITANAPAALTPEQAAVWSYPLADSDRETTIFNMVNALPLRIHQSGHLGELSEETYSLIEEALDYYKTIRQDIKCAVPFWPLGLADVTDTWLSLGLRNGIRNYLAVWRNGDERDICTMKISHLKGRELTIRCAYPSTEDCRYSWNKESGEFTVVLKEAVSARFFEITEKI